MVLWYDNLSDNYDFVCLIQARNNLNYLFIW